MLTNAIKGIATDLSKNLIMEKILNCTPHPITMCDAEGNVFHTFPKGEIVPRLSVKTVQAERISDNGVMIPTTVTVFGAPEGLPEEEPDTFFIVSQLLKAACPDRLDLLVPAEVVRDSQGNIIGCKSLGR